MVQNSTRTKKFLVQKEIKQSRICLANYKADKNSLIYTNAADILQQHEIRSYTELLVTAEKIKLECESDMLSFY